MMKPMSGSVGALRKWIEEQWVVLSQRSRYHELILTTRSVEVVKQGLLDALKLGNRLAGQALKGRFEANTRGDSRSRSSDG